MILDLLSETFASKVLAMEHPIARASFTGFADAASGSDRDVDAFAESLITEACAPWRAELCAKVKRAYEQGAELGRELVGQAAQLTPEQLEEIGGAFGVPLGSGTPAAAS